MYEDILLYITSCSLGRPASYSPSSHFSPQLLGKLSKWRRGNARLGYEGENEREEKEKLQGGCRKTASMEELH